MGERFIKIQNLYSLLDVEPYFLICALVLLAWLFYKLFLKEVSEERHRNLRGHFKNILHHFLILSTFFSVFILINQTFHETGLTRALPYLGLFALASGLIVFVKTSRLILLQYLFLGSMRAGVPVLIVNIFSLVLSIVLLIWAGNQIFGLEVAPLLATSAAFSIILGLAIQDTLGNLFAGVSLQLDKSFEIGDWLEVATGTQKVVGQVKEISWRATLLVGLSQERITIPNRALAGAQISNFSSSSEPIVRSQTFKLPYGTDLTLARQCLLESIKEVKTILSYPEPVTVITESNESWIAVKLVYFVENYGAQYGIADQVVDSALRYLQANNISIGAQRLQILNAQTSAT